ncbi:ABC transporter ATP-binding protein [Agromyces aerolatus]|uniref:ABC transporter ATP-binding protein n=1 Tax=Agromyces sp. LY-1074 TaxID=3074080 RepID=UPI00286272AB|nr:MULTISPECIES: ABC transporter ATP-binding protein [unclassified Agromyces]MDR5699765.1 ABC transporter ATP-binding protein [Agromyces sp. LY-1074]MDR5706061.1 ABC transporter ATP-binding protein [Agromyces sp. LY-1358]
MVEDDTTLLEVSDLQVAYGNVVGLRSLDLTVRAGEIHALLGSNGAGKSSALNAIAGVVPVRSGGVVFRGKDLTRTATWRIAQSGLVLVPEGRQIIGPLTVEENLRLGGFANRRGSDRKALEESVYETFPVLAEYRNTAGGLLSGGQQQMLAFGRALMAEPRLMLLDEPSMGLAPVMVDRILDSVVEIARRGIGVLMVEQNAAALDIADHAAVLEQGVVVTRGEPDEVRDDPRVMRAFLGTAG